MLPTVKLAASVAEAIAGQARASADGNETGGIVLGHDTGAELIVTVAGDPGPTAVRTPKRFLRDLAHAQALADLAYDRDGSVWIGEWHTHPRGPAEPSPLDRRTYRSHLADPSLGFDRFLTLIALPCRDHGWDHVVLAPWVVTRSHIAAVTVSVEEAPGA